MALRSRRGISPVLATLILIVIAVVAGLVVYGWIMGWIGAQRRRAAVALAVSVIRTNSTSYTVEIRNVGSVKVTLLSVTITDPDGDTHKNATSFTPSDTLAPGYSATAITSTTDTDMDTEDPGTEVTVTVECDKGTFAYKVTVE